MGVRLHAIFVNSCSFVSTLRIHQPKAETDRLEIQAIQVEGIKVLDLHLLVTATINVRSLPVQNIELCSENTNFLIKNSPLWRKRRLGHH